MTHDLRGACLEPSDHLARLAPGEHHADEHLTAQAEREEQKLARVLGPVQVRDVHEDGRVGRQGQRCGVDAGSHPDGYVGEILASEGASRCGRGAERGLEAGSPTYGQLSVHERGVRRISAHASGQLEKPGRASPQAVRARLQAGPVQAPEPVACAATADSNDHAPHPSSRASSGSDVRPPRATIAAPATTNTCSPAQLVPGAASTMKR